jgi:hypothetical protein
MFSEALAQEKALGMAAYERPTLLAGLLLLSREAQG